MKVQLWQFGALFFTVTMVLSITLVLISPNRFVEESIRGDYFVAETTNALELNSKLYLLQPNIVLQSSLDAIDWVDTYTIERSLPNQVVIVYQVLQPIACSETSLYYQVTRFDRSNRNETLCNNAIQLNGFIDDSMLNSLVTTPVETRNLIERIEFQRNQATVTMRGGQTAIVYPDDFSGLRSVAKLTPSGTVLDLRQNYE
jgi:hypothetical protein